jgi:hypothetical protein
MKINKSRLAAAVALVFAAGTAGAATTQTWELTPGDTSSPYANTWSFTNTGKTLTLRAYYADGLANWTNGTGDSSINATLKTNTMGAALKTTNGTTAAGIGGFGSNGVGLSNPYDGPMTNGQENSTGGQHAIDNYDINSSSGVYNPTGGTHAHDFLLLDFGEVMAAVDYRIGWKQFNNTDIDFFVAPESLTGPLDLTGTNVSTLVANGWKQVSFTNVSDCVPDPGSPACPTQFSSGAGYNANMKGRYMVAAGALGGNDDAFKLKQITMTIPAGGSTPIPGTAVLLGLGLAGLAWTRRRRAG